MGKFDCEALLAKYRAVLELLRQLSVLCDTAQWDDLDHELPVLAEALDSLPVFQIQQASEPEVRAWTLLAGSLKVALDELALKLKTRHVFLEQELQSINLHNKLQQAYR